MDSFFFYTMSDALGPRLCGTMFTPNFVSLLHGVGITVGGMYNL